MNKIRVIVQAGHLPPMQPGHEGQTGTAGERELVTKIRDSLVDMLNDDGRFEAVPMPGKIPARTHCDAALFLHADGSSNPASSGYSMGYPADPVNAKLARLVSDEFNKIPGHPPHHRDNYTRDMQFYYAFGLVDTPGPEVLVEHGFLTNPAERIWLNAHIANLAAAEYRALLAYFALPDTPDWYRRALTLEPLWAWMLWRDHGAPPNLRPPNVPKRVPAWWWPRRVLHLRGRGTGDSA